jgi:hypothetical protein
VRRKQKRRAEDDVDEVVEQLKQAAAGMTADEVLAQIQASQNAAALQDPQALADWIVQLAAGG